MIFKMNRINSKHGFIIIYIIHMLNLHTYIYNTKTETHDIYLFLLVSKKKRYILFLKTRWYLVV